MATRYLVHATDANGQRITKLIEAESAREAESTVAKLGLGVIGSEVDQGGSSPGRTAPERGPARSAVVADPEETQWEGSPSQWVNFWWYVLCLLVIPIPFAIYRGLLAANTRYALTNQRLRLSWGIIAKRLEETELYRVTDTAVEQSFIQRLLGFGDVIVQSNDQRTPMIRLEAVPDPWGVREQIRTLAEARRRWRKVTEVEVS